MKYRLAFLFGLFCFCNVTAQVNYVLNPGFEEYSHCPFFQDQIMYAKHWGAIDSNWYIIDTVGNGNCSPEYCNTCDTSSGTQIPKNNWFNHYPRNGNGMAHVLMYVDSTLSAGPYQRDYLQGRLSSPLTVGLSYCVSFYVTLTRGGSIYGVNHIGAFLDNGNIDAMPSTCGLAHTQDTPQVIENSIITDTLNWTKIEGSFTAVGTEKFITIGNFSDMLHTSRLITNPNGIGGEAYYLVDDVSVIESNTKAYAWGTDTLHKGYLDSFLLGRNETIPGIKWWRDGALIDTLNAGIWCKDNVLGSYHTYVLSQTLCGVTTWDTVVVSVEAVSSEVGNLQLAVGSLTVWPNPVGDVLHVDAGEDVHVSILGVDGRALLLDCFVPRNDPAISGQAASGIKVEALASGVYFVHVVSESGERVMRKVVKQ